eukprot:2591279-Rhodomonas_salina.1
MAYRRGVQHSHSLWEGGPGSGNRGGPLPVPGAYTPKSNTRKCIPGTKCSEIAVSCIRFRGVCHYRLCPYPYAPCSLSPTPLLLTLVAPDRRRPYHPMPALRQRRYSHSLSPLTFSNIPGADAGR